MLLWGMLVLIWVGLLIISVRREKKEAKKQLEELRRLNTSTRKD